MDKTTALRERLRNCISAVLDLEEDFRAQGMDRALGDEMDMLKSYANRLDGISVDEDVLARLERLTEQILKACVLEGRVSADRDKVRQ